MNTAQLKPKHRRTGAASMAMLMLATLITASVAMPAQAQHIGRRGVIISQHNHGRSVYPRKLKSYSQRQYERGHRAGYEDGHYQGYDDYRYGRACRDSYNGSLRRYSKHFRRGYRAGYSKGYNSGWKEARHHSRRHRRINSHSRRGIDRGDRRVRGGRRIGRGR